MPKVGSLTGSSTTSLLEASTILFSPESTVPTSCVIEHKALKTLWVLSMKQSALGAACSENKDALG